MSVGISVIERKIVSHARTLYHKWQRMRLKNTTFSLIANNCNGGFLLHDLGLPFRSPTINLFIPTASYLFFLQHLPAMLDEPLHFIKTDKTYPVALLANKVRIDFMHYESESEASEKWNERKKKVDYDNLFVLFTERFETETELAYLKEFDKLPYKHKLALTRSPHPDIKSSFCIQKFPYNEHFDIYMYISEHSVKRWLNKFDFVSWFNAK